MCFEYDGVCDFYESHRVKCRKEHKCEGCKRVIRKGEKAMVHSGKFDGRLFRDYECEDCERLTVSIAAEEIEAGCCWSEAWCALTELREYVADRREPVRLLEGTIEECRKQLDELWQAKVAERRELLGRADR